MGKKSKKGKKQKGFVAVDPTTFSFDEREVFGDVFEEPESFEPPPVTWAQRVYLTWLLLGNLQETIVRNNKYSISPHIDAALRERNRLSLPFVANSPKQRIMDALVILRNIVEKHKGEE